MKEKRQSRRRGETNQMRVFQLIEHRDVVQLDVEELVDRFQCAGD